MAGGGWFQTNAPPNSAASDLLGTTLTGPYATTNQGFQTTMPVTPQNLTGPGAQLIPSRPVGSGGVNPNDPTSIASGPLPGSGPAAAGGGGNALQLIQQYQQQNPGAGTSPDRLKGLVAFLNQNGIQATMATHANGTAASDDKVVLPNGQYYDVATDSGWQAPGQANNWDPSVNVVTASGQMIPQSQFLQSQGLPVPAFNPRPDEVAGGSGGAAGAGGMGAYIAPFTGQFTAPTDITEQNDPGYQARLKAGMQAIQQSAAAKGTLLTSGTMKDLNQFGQDYASNEYQNVYNRAANTFGTNYDIFRNNQNDPFNKLYSLTGMGLNATGSANNALSQYGQNVGTFTGNSGINQGGYFNSASQANQNTGTLNAGNTANFYGGLSNAVGAGAGALGNYFANRGANQQGRAAPGAGFGPFTSNSPYGAPDTANQGLVYPNNVYY